MAQRQRGALDSPGRRLLLFALVALGVALLGVAVVVAWPERGPTTQFEIGAVDDFEIGTVTTIPEGRFHLVRPGADEFIALSWVHPGVLYCTVPWRPDFVFPDARDTLVGGWFRDPCTGSTFDKQGHRVFGPAARDMAIVGGQVIVDTSQYSCGFSPPYVTGCASPLASP